MNVQEFRGIRNCTFHREDRMTSQPHRKLFLLVLILLTPACAFAQSPSEPTATVSSNGSRSAHAAVEDRLRALEEELHQQGRTISEMRAVIAEQQRTIGQLTARSERSLQAANGPNDATPRIVNASAGESATATATGEPSPQSSPSANERLDKLEKKVLAFGPFRFSGDFRLRFDGTFRQSNPNPPAGFAALTHAQNARMRYRLRLNFDTDINPKLGFHG